MDSIAAQLIIFIAVVGMAISVSSVLFEVNRRVETGLDEKTEITSNKLLSDIEIVHVGVDSDIYVYVLNTGDLDLNMNDTSLVVDERWIPGSNVTITVVDKATNKDNDYWDPSEIIQMNFSNGSAYSAGRHKAMVIIETGVSDEYKFDI